MGFTDAVRLAPNLLQFTIQNTCDGVDVLTFASFEPRSDVFFLEGMPQSLLPGQSAEVNVLFITEEYAPQTTTLVITSNDPLTSTASIEPRAN